MAPVCYSFHMCTTLHTRNKGIVQLIEQKNQVIVSGNDFITYHREHVFIGASGVTAHQLCGEMSAS